MPFTCFQCGFDDKIKCVLSNGLQSVDDEFDTVIIAGMGGEPSLQIFCQRLKILPKNIILNPMTHPEIARKWLFDNGFEITSDIVVADGRHHYSVCRICS